MPRRPAVRYPYQGGHASRGTMYPTGSMDSLWAAGDAEQRSEDLGGIHSESCRARIKKEIAAREPERRERENEAFRAKVL